jgi:hypothetical protein
MALGQTLSNWQRAGAVPFEHATLKQLAYMQSITYDFMFCSKLCLCSSFQDIVQKIKADE